MVSLGFSMVSLRPRLFPWETPRFPPGGTDAMGFIHHQALHGVTKLLKISDETTPWAAGIGCIYKYNMHRDIDIEMDVYVIFPYNMRILSTGVCKDSFWGFKDLRDF